MWKFVLQRTENLLKVNEPQSKKIWFWDKDKNHNTNYSSTYKSLRKYLMKINLKISLFSDFIWIHKKKVLDSRKFSTSCFRCRLHVLSCPEHDLTIFRKCLSVCISPKFCGHCISRTNARKLMKLFIQLHLDIIWCWLDFGAYRSRSSDVVRNFWFL